MAGRAWAESEVRALAALVRAGASGPAVAAALNRPLGGVKFQVERLGLRLRRGSTVENPWTAGEDAEAVRLAGAGWRLSDIGAELGRSEAAVSARLKRLGVTVGPGRRHAEAVHREPTEAELDALIAEQLKPENLPAWWAAECERVARAERERESQLDAVIRESSRVRVLGRGVRVSAGR
jgi:hypothetical protein